MPTDGLSFAVFVRRQIQGVGLLQLVFKQLDLLALARRNDVDRREVVVDVDAQVGPRLSFVLGRNLLGPLRQVADVADAGLDREPLPRNLLIVRALAGDSTITSAWPRRAISTSPAFSWPCPTHLWYNCGSATNSAVRNAASSSVSAGAQVYGQLASSRSILCIRLYGPQRVEATVSPPESLGAPLLVSSRSDPPGADAAPARRTEPSFVSRNRPTLLIGIAFTSIRHRIKRLLTARLGSQPLGTDRPVVKGLPRTQEAAVGRKSAVGTPAQTPYKSHFAWRHRSPFSASTRAS